MVPRHTLDQLVVLEAIAREGTFAGAARTLGRVRSAVSYAVRGLEEALGVEVFDRAGHKATLTPAGRRVLEEAEAVLGHARRLEQVAQTLHDGWEPTLSIVVDGVYPTEPLIAALRAFSERHDAPTRIVVHVEYQSGVQARFVRDGADLMLMLEFDGTGSLEATQLPSLEMLLVVAADHPLAGGSVTRDDLRAHVELVTRDSAPSFSEAPREAWFGSRNVAYLADFHSKRAAISGGAGYGWLPGWLAAPGLADGSLARVGFAEGNRWVYRPYLVHRRDLLGRAGRLFREAVLEEVRRLDFLFGFIEQDV